MENSKDQTSNFANDDENPTNITTHTLVDSSFPPSVAEETANPNRPSSLPRTPFTNLGQVDADLALARTLQDQERAYMMLRMNGDESDHESWVTDSYVDDDDDDQYNSQYDGSDIEEEEEDAFDDHDHFDEAYAQALQDAEGQETAARLRAFAGGNGMVTEEDMNDHGDNSQDSWDDVDPDELSYEELIALGEVVGTESRGLSADSIASLRSLVYKTQNGCTETCVICRLDYEDGDNLILLSCKHSYHSDCITNWLQINKVCPVCNTEVPTSG